MGQCVSSKSNPEIIINPNEYDCAICLEHIPIKMRKNSYTRYYYKTNCGHIYCKSCIIHALRYSNLCPMCRSHITLKGLLKRQYEIYNEAYTNRLEMDQINNNSTDNRVRSRRPRRSVRNRGVSGYRRGIHDDVITDTTSPPLPPVPVSSPETSPRDIPALETRLRPTPPVQENTRQRIFQLIMESLNLSDEDTGNITEFNFTTRNNEDNYVVIGNNRIYTDNVLNGTLIMQQLDNLNIMEELQEELE